MPEQIVTPTPTPCAAPPGALAESRLGAETFARIRRAKQITFVSAADRKSGAITAAPADRIPGFAARLADLLRDDRIYTAELSGIDGAGDVELRLRGDNRDSSGDIVVTVFARKNALRIRCPHRGVTSSTPALLAPVAQPLLRLLREIAPANTVVSRLAFPPRSIVSTTPLPPLPADILRDVRAVRPGMRRADVLRLLETEGGIQSARFGRFVHRKMIANKVVAVAVEFVPASARIRWIEGRGYPLTEPSARTMPREKPDDIAVRVFPPEVRYGIGD